MTRKSKKYQLLIRAPCFLFFTGGGIDVYAQEPVTRYRKIQLFTQPRKHQKARARRHRDPDQVMDSLKKIQSNIASGTPQATDSLSAAKIQIADSLDAANKKN